MAKQKAKTLIKDTLGLIAFLIATMTFTPLVILGGIYWIIAAKVMKSKKNVRYSINLLYTIDQSVNTIMGGHPDETISSRLGRSKLHGARYWWVRLLQVVVDFLADSLFNDYEHCVRSIIDLEQQKFKIDKMEVWDWIGPNY